jgi:hypothetical protein
MAMSPATSNNVQHEFSAALIEGSRETQSGSFCSIFSLRSEAAASESALLSAASTAAGSLRSLFFF